MSVSFDVLVLGASGRLGSSIVAAINEQPDINFKFGLSRTLAGDHYGAQCQDALNHVHCVVDASVPEAFPLHLQCLERNPKPLVLAVTGFEYDITQRLQALATHVPVLIAPNLSQGVAWMNQAVKSLAQVFVDADIDIIETHHKNKRDVPSGTAKFLANAVVEGSPSLSRIVVESSKSGCYEPNTVVVHSIRAGDVVGEHTVRFTLDGEVIELRHEALSRKLFALGALRAMRFLVNCAPGIYQMADILSGGDVS